MLDILFKWFLIFMQLEKIMISNNITAWAKVVLEIIGTVENSWNLFFKIITEIIKR